MAKNNDYGTIDKMLLYVTLVLLAIGLVMVFSASSYDAMISYKDAMFFFKRQLVWAAAGIVAMIFMMVIPVELVKKLMAPATGVIMIALVAVLLFGSESHGATRGFRIGGMQISPAEFAKPICIVMYAQILSWMGSLTKTTKGFLTAIGILAVPILPIIIEDLGTAVCLALTLGCMLVVAGIKFRQLLTLGVMGGGLAAVFIAIKPYRVKRFFSFLDPFSDPTGSGWQIVQSLYALGSGGLFGVGLGNSRQKMLYLPERHTDFIYAIICEELGIIGAMAVVLLFLYFLYRGCLIAQHLEDNFMSYAAFGLTLIVVIQAYVNIAVVIGLFPITGITLPLISYGGSSLLCTLASIGFLLNLPRYADKPRHK